MSTRWSALGRRQRGVLRSTLAANALVFFDQTATAVALAVLGRDLGMRPVDQQWVITAYLLALAGLMPVAGRLADHLGRRPLYLGGLALFGVGTALCALAPSAGILIAARFVQGAGGAFVQPTGLAATTDAVPDADRGWAIGLLSTGGTSFLALGPIIAGALLHVFDWRILFAVPLPVVVYAFVEGWRSLPDQREPNPRPLSAGSVALLLGGLLLTVLGVSQLTQWGWASVAPLAVGLVLLTTYAWRDLRADHPILPLHLLTDRRLATSLAALVAIQFAVLSVTVYLALYLQHGLGWSAFSAGIVIAGAGIWTPLLSLRTGRTADARGARVLVVPGLVLTTAGLAWLAATAHVEVVWWLVPGLVLFGLSRPLVFTPASVGPTKSLPPDARTTASSLVTEARQVGAALGVALSGVAWMAFGSQRLDDVSGVQFAASTSVALGVVVVAAVVVWRWMPAT